ncbi:hypothetical protein PHLCEN_2v4061 [Hermanssonia centrifuga]|uniref:Peptidase C14 caspase domain-containing protein n=1 Tax=Hermanssonia centrifuga TaxID=98765 RepID=A0A2R6Q5J3_9APHY|nr:hypothetical protein PHLCEN_2v4061 [Hermanssonia centrifuga]
MALSPVTSSLAHGRNKLSIPKLFALIIGIDEYSDNNIRNLSGAVADANAIEAYLVDTLCIPKAYITVLRNKQATGEAIVNAIQGLGEDYRINRGDPILLFYAGHGAQTKTPMDLMEVWSPHISMLIPHDFAPTNSQSRAGQGVLDITLSHCLAEIADKKGDNIMQSKIPGLHTHVLLSACKEGETAKERCGRGAFTSVLLDTLRAVGTDKISYRDLITRLPDFAAE